mmetsp:Transcript_23137/g.60461  ORF Transcript_23137/g.60461 Transcript_23137/m.60461 type:complete len:403 (+) Transcript_23137:20-1228(+)
MVYCVRGALQGSASSHSIDVSDPLNGDLGISNVELTRASDVVDNGVLDFRWWRRLLWATEGTWSATAPLAIKMVGSCGMTDISVAAPAVVMDMVDPPDDSVKRRSNDDEASCIMSDLRGIRLIPLGSVELPVTVELVSRLSRRRIFDMRLDDCTPYAVSPITTMAPAKQMAIVAPIPDCVELAPVAPTFSSRLAPVASVGEADGGSVMCPPVSIFDAVGGPPDGALVGGGGTYIRAPGGIATEKATAPKVTLSPFPWSTAPTRDSWSRRTEMARWLLWRSVPTPPPASAESATSTLASGTPSWSSAATTVASSAALAGGASSSTANSTSTGNAVRNWAVVTASRGAHMPAKIRAVSPSAPPLSCSRCTSPVRDPPASVCSAQTDLSGCVDTANAVKLPCGLQ